MNFINHTPFPAQAFEGIDQEQRAFHVVVMRQTLSFTNGVLDYAELQEPLCEADADLADGPGVRQESDLCPRKPYCDIIANATAYAPQGEPRTAFTVRLTVRKSDSPAPLPLRPQGLNQFDDPAPNILAHWRAQVEYAKQHPLPGGTLVDKSLCVSGARRFIRKSLFTRTLHSIVRLGTLGLLRPNPWKLTPPLIVSTLPLNESYAFGGECRINAGDRAAKRVPAKQRLTPAALAAHPEHGALQSKQPVRHTICQSNPHGRGFVDSMHLKACKIRTVTAPQIERIDAKLDASLFWRALHKRLRDGSSAEYVAFEPAGFGTRSKSHPSRRTLAGTVDNAFSESECALPKDFDFAFLNAAPSDQQAPFLCNDETIELVNLCTPDTPGTTRDNEGNVTLRLTLLRHECFVLCRQDGGVLFRQALEIDTLIVEPDTQTVTLVWRGTMDKNSASPLRVCEARMHSHLERDRVARGLAAIAGAMCSPATPTPLPTGAPR